MVVLGRDLAKGQLHASLHAYPCLCPLAAISASTKVATASKLLWFWFLAPKTRNTDDYAEVMH